MKKIKIIFCASSDSIHYQKWIDYYLNDKYDITWISFDDHNFEKVKNIKLLSFKRPKFFIEWSFIYLKLKKITSKLKPDIIHVHSIGYYGILGLLLNCKNKIYTIWGSDLLINTSNFLLPLKVIRSPTPPSRG